jgi:hypothetical protein
VFRVEARLQVKMFQQVLLCMLNMVKGKGADLLILVALTDQEQPAVVFPQYIQADHLPDSILFKEFVL